MSQVFPRPSRRQVRTLAVSLALGLAAGCAHKAPPPPAPLPPAPAPALTDPRTLSQRLQELTSQLADQAALPPTDGVGEYKSRTAATLTTLADLLTQLGGPQPGGAFLQQLAIVRSSHDRLVAAEPQRVIIEPIIDMGLRASANALDSQAGRFPEQERLPADLQVMRDRIAHLDSERGPLHQTVVGEAVRAIHAVAADMTQTIAARAALATTEPASQPTTEPAMSTSQPAASTSPTSAPTTMP